MFLVSVSLALAPAGNEEITDLTLFRSHPDTINEQTKKIRRTFLKRNLVELIMALSFCLKTM
jgi:hypothetical protein